MGHAGQIICHVSPRRLHGLPGHGRHVGRKDKGSHVPLNACTHYLLLDCGSANSI